VGFGDAGLVPCCGCCLVDRNAPMVRVIDLLRSYSRVDTVNSNLMNRIYLSSRLEGLIDVEIELTNATERFNIHGHDSVLPMTNHSTEGSITPYCMLGLS
jgi:hypothetical protein